MANRLATHCAVCEQKINTATRSRRPQLQDLCKACLKLPQQAINQWMLKVIFEYNPETGLLTHARDFPHRKKGDIATFDGGDGYLNVRLSRNHRAHRVIWFLMTGAFPEQIDHINHNRADNRWANLRNTSQAENMLNMSPNRRNKLGIAGVHKMTGRDTYRAEIVRNGERIHIGVFKSAEEAGIAYREAAEVLGFHSNHAKRI